MERASAAIAAAGGPGDAPRIEGPQGKAAVTVYGASLTLRGVAVAASKGNAVYCVSKGRAELVDCTLEGGVSCISKGRAELAGCTLSSPKGIGLYVADGATAEVQGGTIADCPLGVRCYGSGAKATVRTAKPTHRRDTARNSAPVGGVFRSLALCLSARSLARRNRREEKANPGARMELKNVRSRKQRSKTN